MEEKIEVRVLGITMSSINSEAYAVTANTDRGATLSEGDQVIVSGNLNLADGSRVVLKQ